MDRNEILQGLLERIEDWHGWRARQAALWLNAYTESEATAGLAALRARHAQSEDPFWQDGTHWSAPSAAARCLAMAEQRFGLDGLSLLEPLEAPEALLDALQGLPKPGWGSLRYGLGALPALSILARCKDSTLTARHLAHWECRSWLEKYERSLLQEAQHHGGDCVMSSLRPDWVSTAFPLLFREGLAGALTRRALVRDGRALLLEVEDEAVEWPGQWLLFGDVDHLAQLNAQGGMRAGHAAISQVLNSAQRVVGDRVIRWGGDEFLIVLEEGDGAAIAAAVCEAITEDSAHFVAGCAAHSGLEQACDFQLSASLGVVSTEKHASTALMRVQAAMMRAKREARGKAVVQA
ncbi:MAG: diguanylate cyclase [Myxococcota bacterium]|jgi:diguanylate cyclase (GGDEF)-like protein|nr:diguanylate cyclase [Myxococcota bacterium]